MQALYLNNAAEPFDQLEVRQALCYAIDPQNIIDTVDYGYGTEIGTAMIPGLAAYYDESLADTYAKDTEKARELLAKAGYPDGFSFTVTVPSVYQVHVDTAQVLVNDLAEAGITMNSNHCFGGRRDCISDSIPVQISLRCGEQLCKLPVGGI